jgi:uncharacterized membrane protein
MDYDIGVRIVLLVLMVGTGLLLIWIARATASGRVKRNSIAGIRIPSTMVSDEAWLAAHIRAKRATIFAGIAAGASGLIVLLPMPDPMLAAVVLAGAAVTLGFVLCGARVGGRAAVEITNASDG